MTAATVKPTQDRDWGASAAQIVDEWVVAPVRAALTYAPQAMITSASVYMNAGFAQSHGLLHPVVAWAQAIGFEWTYLRGLSMAKKTTSPWVDRLNWGALITVLASGIMYCLYRFGQIPAAPTGWAAVLLALAHVVPLAWSTLCAAMIHRDMGAEQAKRDADAAAAQRTLDEQRAQQLLEIEIEAARRRAEIETEDARRRAELETWVAGQQMKQQLGLTAGGRSRPRPARPAGDQGAASTTSEPCPRCSRPLSAQQLGALRSIQARGARWRGCGSCRQLTDDQVQQAGAA